jgi:predicted small metal-binding protein
MGNDMSKYYIDCREVGWQDCTFSAEADTIEQVVEQLADHVRIHHHLKASARNFTQDKAARPQA